MTLVYDQESEDFIMPLDSCQWVIVPGFGLVRMRVTVEGDILSIVSQVEEENICCLPAKERIASLAQYLDTEGVTYGVIERENRTNEPTMYGVTIIDASERVKEFMLYMDGRWNLVERTEAQCYHVAHSE